MLPGTGGALTTTEPRFSATGNDLLQQPWATALQVLLFRGVQPREPVLLSFLYHRRWRWHTLDSRVCGYCAQLVLDARLAELGEEQKKLKARLDELR